MRPDHLLLSTNEANTAEKWVGIETAVEKWLYVSDLCPSWPALWMPQSAQQHPVACITHAALATGTPCGRQMGWHYNRLSSPVTPPKIKKDVIKQKGTHQRQHLAKQTIVLRHFLHYRCSIWQSHSSIPLHSAAKWPPTAVTMRSCYHTTIRLLAPVHKLANDM